MADGRLDDLSRLDAWAGDEERHSDIGLVEHALVVEHPKLAQVIPLPTQPSSDLTRDRRAGGQTELCGTNVVGGEKEVGVIQDSLLVEQADKALDHVVDRAEHRPAPLEDNVRDCTTHAFGQAKLRKQQKRR